MRHPGPELPLVSYTPANCLKGDDVDVRTFDPAFYRAVLRCYALELFPLEVFSITKWRQLLIDTLDPAALHHRIAIGARFKLDDMSLRFDPHIGLRLNAKQTNRKTWAGVIQAPVFQIGDGLWLPTFYYAHAPDPLFNADEFRSYQNKCIRVLIRLRNLGLRVRTNATFKYCFKTWLGLPDISTRFHKPFAGAIVRNDEGREGWVVRELGDLVVVEHEEDGEFEEQTYPHKTLEVIG